VRVVWLIRTPRQQALVQCYPGAGSQIVPTERNAGGQRRSEQVREGNDQLVFVALGILDVEKTFAAGSAGLVDHHYGLFRQIVLGNDALHHARHLIGSAASSGGHYDFDWFGGFPCLNWHGYYRKAANTDDGQTYGLGAHFPPP